MSKRKSVNFLRPFLFCAILAVLTVFMNSGFVQAADKPAKPKASVKAGTYYVTSTKSVKLSCTTDGATIYYSTDGKTYNKYSKALKLDKSCTLYAYSELKGVKSDVLKNNYKLKVRLSGITPDAGEYDGSQIVKITTKAKDVTIYYTLDGSKPTTKSKKYTSSGIEISKTCTLRLLVKKSGFTNRYTTKEYVINNGSGTVLVNTGNAYSISSGTNITDFVLTDGCDIYGRKFDDRVYYSKLNDSEKKLYALLYNSILHYEEKCDVSLVKVSSSRAFEIYEYLVGESPELFWVNDGSIGSLGTNAVFSLNVKFTNTKNEANSRFIEMDKKADSIVKEALKKDDMYDRVLYIHDWIVDNADYSYGNIGTRDLAGTDDIILDGHGLCTAYARALAFLCHKAGIECVTVNGRANNGSGMEEHSWSKLKIDGNWYAMDITWDDPVLAGGSTLDDYRSYSYFCLTDSEMNRDHKQSSEFDFADMACIKSDYSYITRNGIETFDDAWDAFCYLKETALINRNNGKLKTEVSCTTTDIANKLFEYIRTNSIGNMGYSIGFLGTIVYIEFYN